MWNSSLRKDYFAWVPQPASSGPAAQREYYLSDWYFALVIGVALLLHMGAVWVWQSIPKAQVIDIPVRVLNIKLGDSESEETAIAQPGVGNKSAVEDTISRLVRDQEAETQAHAQAPAPPSPRTDEPVLVPPSKKTEAPARPRKENIRGKIDVRQEGTATAAPIMPVEASSPTQFVRSTNAQADLQPDTSKPTKQREAEMVSRYEQLISMWIQKFKVYPEEARRKGMQGETVVRIRIDRQGNIRYQILERTTGHQPLDRAAIDMIRRANPVPAVPNDYPAGDLFEFLVPVSFHLQ
jgi:protein TonB